MVQFLAFFKITPANASGKTKGSHNKYSDEIFQVILANHTNESKPEEVESVLKVVLRKLTT